MGALPDKDFFSAMAICDAVVLPYLEVGQNSSGPISVALEMGARVIASRTHAFMNFGKYHPGLIEYFDIGNYAELADRLVARPATTPGVKRLAYNTDTNVADVHGGQRFPGAAARCPGPDDHGRDCGMSVKRAAVLPPLAVLCWRRCHAAARVMRGGSRAGPIDRRCHLRRRSPKATPGNYG